MGKGKKQNNEVKENPLQFDKFHNAPPTGEVNMADIIRRQLSRKDQAEFMGKIEKPKPKPKPTHPDLPDNIQKKLEGRSDLWINQLRKQKEQQEAVEDDDDGDWEDDDGEDEIESNLEQFNPETTAVEKLDRRTVKFHPSIQLKKFDENGLPLDGYDYSQHILPADQLTSGDTVIDYYVKPTEFHHMTVDMDYQPEEMTKEQYEVYEALQYDGQDPLYEELEDDFVALANGGEQCIIAAKIKDETAKEPVIVKKQQNFQHASDSEEEIPSSKNPRKKSEQSDEENEENDSSNVDMDSEAEREFEREMQNYEDDEDDDKVEDLAHAPTYTKMNQVIDDHLAAMNKKREPKKESQVEVDMKRERELYLLKSKDPLAYLKEKYPNTDPSEFYLPKEVQKLELEQDIALQNYIKYGSGDEKEESEGSDREVETIVSRQFQMSQMSKISPEELNIIKYHAFKKKGKKQVKPIKEEKEELEMQAELKHEQEVKKLKKLVRSKDETEEEKKQRKALVKQIKQEKKNKKSAFKNALQGLAKDHAQQIEQNRKVHLPGTVKVI